MNLSMKTAPASVSLTGLSSVDTELESGGSATRGHGLLSRDDDRVDEVSSGLFMAAEQFRYMQRKLNQVMPQGGVVLLTSAIQGEGKSFNACNLAYALAEAKGSTLLLDLDLRRPVQISELGLGQGNLLDVLRGDRPVAESAFRMPGVPLSVLGTSELVTDPLALLRSAHLGKIFAWARENVRWTIVDGPPVLPLADSEELLPLVDTVLLVARERVTPAGALKRAVERLGSRLHFVIYNDAAPVRSYGYGYAVNANYSKLR